MSVLYCLLLIKIFLIIIFLFQISTISLQCSQNPQKGSFQTRRLQRSARQCCQTSSKVPTGYLYNIGGCAMALDAISIRYELFIVVVIVCRGMVADNIYPWWFKRDTFGKNVISIRNVLYLFYMSLLFEILKNYSNKYRQTEHCSGAFSRSSSGLFWPPLPII